MIIAVIAVIAVVIVVIVVIVLASAVRATLLWRGRRRPGPRRRFANRYTDPAQLPPWKLRTLDHARVVHRSGGALP